MRTDISICNARFLRKLPSPLIKASLDLLQGLPKLFDQGRYVPSGQCTHRTQLGRAELPEWLSDRLGVGGAEPRTAPRPRALMSAALVLSLSEVENRRGGPFQTHCMSAPLAGCVEMVSGGVRRPGPRREVSPEEPWHQACSGSQSAV